MKELKFSTKLYVKAHGAEPCGVGNWSFLVDGEDERVYAPYGLSLPEAKRWLKTNYPNAAYASVMA